MRESRSGASGFSALETIVAMALILGLTAAVSASVRRQMQVYGGETAQSLRQSSLRYWAERVARDVRRACYDPQRSRNFRILVHERDEIRFSFARDDDGDGRAEGSEIVGYRSRDGRLERLQGSSWRGLVEGLEEASFTYRDASGDETTSPGSIVFVEIRLSARAARATAPGLPPPRLSQSLAAEIRNATDCQS
jgi:type II secretory pathway component PulJ